MPLPFNLILGQLKPNTVSSVAMYHQKLGSRNETDPRKSKTSTCFRIIHGSCCTCSDQHWFEVQCPQPHLEQGSMAPTVPMVPHRPYCVPQGLCSTLPHNSDTGHQWYPRSSTVTLPQSHVVQKSFLRCYFEWTQHNDGNAIKAMY